MSADDKGKAAPQVQKPSRVALDKYYSDWEAKMKSMQEGARAVDWSAVDFSKLRPSDLAVQFGPMLTEEQFKEYRKNNTVHVIKQDGNKKKL